MSNPAINERVKYHSPFRTGTYDAIITSVHGDLVDIDVLLPGIEDTVHLRALRFGEKERVRPK